MEESLNKGDVIAVGLVDFRSIPFAETVCADTLEVQIATDDGELLLHGALGDGKDQDFPADAISSQRIERSPAAR